MEAKIPPFGSRFSSRYRDEAAWEEATDLRVTTDRKHSLATTVRKARTPVKPLSAQSPDIHTSGKMEATLGQERSHAALQQP